MKEIQLTQGLVALIDDTDLELINKHKWSTRMCVDRPYAATAVKVNGKYHGLYMHRLIMDAPKGIVVDHINGDSLDNRRDNLRLATQGENSRNRKPNTGCEFKGVRYSNRDKRFMVAIMIDRKIKYVGSFLSKEEAARAYDEAAIKYHGEFARLNFPEEKERGLTE